MSRLSPKRSLPGRIFRHLLGEYLTLLICCVLAFLVLFLVTDIFNDLQDFLARDVPMDQTIGYFMMRQPMNLVYVLPVAVLLSLCFLVYNLIRHQELTAIRAAGLSIPVVALPIWVCAGLLAVTLLCVNEFAGPRLLRRATAFHERVTADEGDRLLGRTPCLAYRNRAEVRDWFFEAFAHEGTQKGVSVKQHNPVKPGMLWEIRAEEADFVDGCWVFRSGTKWHYGADGMLPESEERFDRLVVPSLTEPPSEIFNDLRPLRELSALDILRILNKNPDLPEATTNPLNATFWYRLTFPLSVVVASLYGVGLSVRPQRSGAFRGFAVALAMMAAYYVVTQLAVLVGKYGFIPGWSASVVPNLFFLGHGVAVVYTRR